MIHKLIALLLLAAAVPASAQVSFTGTPYVQDFNTLSGTTNNTTNVTWTDNSTLPGWYASKSAYHVTDATMGGAATNFDLTSTTNNIGLISFGSAGSAERALGSRATSTTSLSTTNAPVQYGVRLVNNTAQTITRFSVMFTGEQWYASTQSAAHTLQVDYSIGATSLTSGTYVSNFTTFTAPVSTGTTARALDGNAVANRRGVARLVTGVSWAPGQELWIRITDTNESGNEQGLAVDDFVFTSEPNSGLFFDGATNHVTMGAATSTLGASVFTLEAWIFRTGTGTTTSTGSGGVTACPIVTKGRSQNDTAGFNCNYFLGINAANQLVADFEAAAASGITTGQNYPVIGASTIPYNQWVHVAATYDGGATDGEKWKLFVNGVKDTTNSTTGVNPPTNAAPEAISTQHFAIGTAMDSNGSRDGTFLGLIDEVRLWNVARSDTQITGDKGVEITSGSGLLARYGFGEGSGATTASSVAGAPGGTLSGSPMWMHGKTFVINLPPTASLTAPTNGASFDAPASINLAATATDTDGIGKVEFFNGATKLGEDNSAPYEFVWNNVISGNHVLTAVATDSLGAAATSNAVNVSVTNTDNAAPSVSLTAPASGATIVTNSITLTADAADTDGVIAKVEFFEGVNKLGEDLTSPYSFNWASVTTGNYTITAVATDNDSGTTTSSPVSFSVAVPISTTLLAKGGTWKYLDNGSDQGAAWKEASFNDSAWSSGVAPLGGGDAHIVTNVNLGPASPNRHITTYFRRSFNVTGAAAVQAITLNILRDDGVVVYINGTEVARQNMPAGAVNYLTNAPLVIGGTDESTYFASTASPFPALTEGTNTIAVELHQRDGTSSDLGFDLELITFSLPGTPPTVAITAPANSATFEAPATIAITADAADADGTVSKVEFFNGAAKLGENVSSPYTFDWTTVPQGSYTLTAKATDNFGLSTTSAAVNITVDPPNTIAPSVAITAPDNNSNWIAPAAITIAADATDSDGTVSKVEFFNGVTKLGEDAVSPYTFDWTNVPAGDYTLTAKATDNLTASTVSSAVVVHVLPNQPPVITPVFPAELASVPAPATDLQVSLSDPESQPLTVTFYGRPKTAAPGPDFTLVTLPDTQFYSENNNNRLPQFISQTNWIVDSRNTLNTAFVAHMGDMVQNGDAVVQEWINADGAMDIIENPATTLLTHGIPWGGAPGNHDQQPIGSPDGASLYWNTYFGTARWNGRSYWGGNYSTNNDNNYQLFSASGMDFIIINLEYRPSANQAVLDWADALLKAYPTRRAIITSHWLIGIGNPAAWGGHGQAVYDNLKDNPNLFMMLCGHIHGEGQRSDTFEGRTVHTVLQDYQSRADGEGGGGSWLRYFVFSPANNAIYAKTYRTTTGTFETDADSQFTIPYNMTSSPPWTELETVNVPGGGNAASGGWTGLTVGAEYEWYAAVSDGFTPVSTSVRSFTAVAPPTVTIAATDAAAGELGADQALEFTVTRTGPTAGALALPLTASGSASAGDYSGFTGSVTIPATQASATVPLTVLADAEAEGPETITLALGSSTNFIAGSPASADAGIADKPEQGFYFANIADPGKRAPGDDADGDNNANVIEYFMGSLPDDANSRGVLEIPTTGSNTFKVRYPRARNRADVGGSLRWSGDLTSWHADGQSNGIHTVTFAEAVVSAPEADPEIIEATATITGPGTAPAVFVRLAVQ